MWDWLANLSDAFWARFGYTCYDWLTNLWDAFWARFGYTYCITCDVEWIHSAEVYYPECRKCYHEH